jgi:hypothetical protein
MMTKFRRFGVKVDECLYLDGEPFFSAEAIGKFLVLKNPKRAVNKIVKNHPHITEFAKEIKVIDVKSQPLSGTDTVPSENPHHKTLSAEKDPSNSHSRRTYTKRFFDLMGFFLIAQESHTPVAIQCKAMLARLGKMFLLGKLVERTPEEIEVEQHLDNYVRIKKGYGIRTEEIKQYMLKTGCSPATAYRHAAKVKRGESPFDKNWGNFMKPVIDEDLGLKIREIYFANPSMTMKDIWREIGEKPSYTSVKKYVKKLKKERLAAEGK